MKNWVLKWAAKRQNDGLVYKVGSQQSTVGTRLIQLLGFLKTAD